MTESGSDITDWRKTNTSRNRRGAKGSLSGVRSAGGRPLTALDVTRTVSHGKLGRTVRTVLKRFFQRRGDTRAFGSEATSTEVGAAASVNPAADIAVGVRDVAGIAAGVRTDGSDEATPEAL